MSNTAVQTTAGDAPAGAASAPAVTDAYVLAHDSVDDEIDHIKVREAPVSKTDAGNIALTVWQTLLFVNKATGAATTVTLPPVADLQAGHEVQIVDAKGDAGVNNITVDTDGAETIEGGASVVLNANFSTAKFMFDGTNWIQLR